MDERAKLPVDFVGYGGVFRSTQVLEVTDRRSLLNMLRAEVEHLTDLDLEDRFGGFDPKQRDFHQETGEPLPDSWSSVRHRLLVIDDPWMSSGATYWVPSFQFVTPDEIVVGREPEIWGIVAKVNLALGAATNPLDVLSFWITPGVTSETTVDQNPPAALVGQGEATDKIIANLAIGFALATDYSELDINPEYTP